MKEHWYILLKSKIHFYLAEAKIKKNNYQDLDNETGSIGAIAYSQEIFRLNKLLDFCREIEDGV